MTLLEAIQACAEFTHKLPGHIYAELRGRRVSRGIELDATDGANVLRVLVPSVNLAPVYACLPQQWTLSPAEAQALIGMGQLTLAADGSSTVAKVGKSGKPGKAKPGPVFHAFSAESQRGRKWATFDLTLSKIWSGLSPQALVTRAALVRALAPLDGGANVILRRTTGLLELRCDGWTSSLELEDQTHRAPHLPIRLLVSALWCALAHMDEPQVLVSWAAFDGEAATRELLHEGGPARLDCGGVCFVTMPLREHGLPVKRA